jgi:hypothetical protein
MENLRTSESHGGVGVPQWKGSAAELVCVCVKLARLLDCVEAEILIYTNVSYCRFSDDPQNMHVSCAENKYSLESLAIPPPLTQSDLDNVLHIQVPSVCFNLNW